MKTPLSLLAIFLAAAFARAGPPFVTDDPEPVDYQHWEIDLGSQTQHGPDGASGTIPHLELNYGLLPNLQVHLIAPEAFAAAGGGSRHFGYGDTELGIKYRLFQGSDSLPEIAAFPLVELPTGSAARGLGTGRTQLYLPLWLQRSSGSWTAYGGGGYWIHPGAGNRNYWFSGAVLQKQALPNLALGVEIFAESPQATRGRSTVQSNLGETWDINEHWHILASAGPSISGPKGYETYLAIQLTFGPAKIDTNTM